MTLNKSIISVAAASLLAAGFAGCGSSSSSTPVTPTTQPTSITATDGYVLNYSVTATYSDGNTSAQNYTTTAALTSAVTNAKIVAGSTQTAGSAVLDLSELNSSVLDNLQYITLSQKAQSSDGTTLTYGTFFDANGDNKFVAADGDIVAPSAFSMKAPAGYKNITPITSLIQARIDTLVATDTNDTNRSEVMALALTQISDALGISEDNLKNVDPMDVISSEPAYALVNAVLGQAVTDGDLTNIATSLATATKATSAVSALRNIATGATVSAAYFTSTADQFEADSSMLASVSTMNLDATRTNTSAAQNTFTPTLLVAGSADFNVSNIEINGKDVDLLLGSGAKVGFTSLDTTTIDLAASTDANTTNKSFTLAIKIGAQESRVNADANISSLTILVPMEINNTVDEATKKINAVVSGDVTWEGVLPSGATFSGDMNSSVFTNVSGASDINYGVVNPVSIPDNVNGATTMTLNIGDILTAIDKNSTEENIMTDDSIISDLKIALVDSNSTFQLVNGTKSEYWGNTAIASVKGGINVNGKSIFKNATTDARNGLTSIGANVPAKTTVTLSSATGSNTAINGYAAANNVNALAGNHTYVINEGTTTHFTVASLYENTDTGEKNTTIAFTKSTKTLDGNTSATVVDVNATAVTNLSAKISNSSTDETPSQTELIKLSSSAARPLGSSAVAGGGYSMATYNVISTDEFNKASVAGADSNITFVYNAKPTVDVNSSTITLLLDATTNASAIYASNLTVGSDTVVPVSGTTTLTKAWIINDEEASINALTNASSNALGGFTIMGVGVGSSTTLASANISETGNGAAIVSTANASQNLMAAIATNNATAISISSNNGSGYAEIATVTLANVSNGATLAFSGNSSSNATGIANMSTTTFIAVRLNVYDKYDANTTKDLYIKFTK
ncbi:MAG: hypothetical protein GQ570_01570 [Helicobacteraceae bacterium]|nr:hypothetical protein [Helicobacteraceae bacterium]